jgi:uncharacterized protein YigA (DUF484 family)
MSNEHPMNPITEDDIANYLVHHPDFFNRQAEMLASVRLSSPHGQRAVSLQERQAEMLRDKIRGLEARIMDMIRHGTENSALNDRLLRWAGGLLTALDATLLPTMMVDQIKSHFMVPQAAIRVWNVAPEHRSAPFAQMPSEEVRAWAATLTSAYCGAPAHEEINRWMEQPDQVQSMAVMALHHPEGELLGMMALASPDPHRYHAGMGTDLLERIGQMAGSALTRLVVAH